MNRILVVTAHPDDEVGGFGGTLLKYRAQGAETYIICLTAGEAATNRGRAKDDGELAEIRRGEFAAACNVLKISQAWILDYKDGALDRENCYRVVGELVKRIREIRPQVILTFGPDGSVTAHPDHSIASVFTTLAFHWAGRNNRFADQFWTELKQHRVQKFYYQTASAMLPDRPAVSPSPITCEIEISAYFEEKLRAFRQHFSQEPLFDTFETYMRKRPRYELFHLAASDTPRKCEMETDILAGITEG
jgi:LmbE family N-acetylglucosaminyl deacetylase